MLKKRILHHTILFSICFVLFWFLFSIYAHGEEDTKALQVAYESYQQRFLQVNTRWQIEGAGFQVIEEQVFPIETKSYGQVFMVPAIDEEYHRLVLFFARENGTIVFKTDQLECNNRNPGKLEQPVVELTAVSFQELNWDGRMDIILIVTCINSRGSYRGNPYKVGEVLFQDDQGFYRDYRISDKINRFSMNKSAKCIAAFVKGGYSTEFLYTASTKQELLAHGFEIAREQCYYRQFEKLGRLEVVPGTYTMADFATFMIYLINEQGDIVWSFQPMGDYDNLYALKGITCKDIDGDGMKDILVLARYSYEGQGNELIIESDYSVYYQRTGGFYKDTELVRQNPCSDEDTVASLVERARAYWGWKVE